MYIQKIDKAIIKFIRALEKIDNFEDIVKISISLANITKAIQNNFPIEYAYSTISHLYILIETKTKIIRNTIIENIEKANNEKNPK